MTSPSSQRKIQMNTVRIQTVFSLVECRFTDGTTNASTFNKNKKKKYLKRSVNIFNSIRFSQVPKNIQPKKETVRNCT